MRRASAFRKSQVAGVGLFVALQAGAQTGELGRWVTESGNLEVEIAPCGPALCGTVVRVLANRSMSKPEAEFAGLTSADGRPVLGMKILSGFASAGGGEWKGEIYNRENGKTYSCILSLAAPDELKVHSYIGLPLIGKTQIWRRAAEPAEKN